MAGIRAREGKKLPVTRQVRKRHRRSTAAAAAAGVWLWMVHNASVRAVGHLREVDWDGNERVE
eukprot:COSAG02_NODE_2775_length_8040_cov_9.109365_12_plen_63_part_00